MGSLEGSFLFNHISGKQAWIHDRKDVVKQFSVAQFLPEPTRLDDVELRPFHNTLAHLCTPETAPPFTASHVLLTETLHRADPSGRSLLFQESKQAQIKGLREKNSFEVVPDGNMPLVGTSLTAVSY